MNQKSIIAVLGVVVVILIGTTVYFATINITSQPVVPAPKVTQQPTVTPVPAVQPTQPVANQQPVAQSSSTTSDLVENRFQINNGVVWPSYAINYPLGWYMTDFGMGIKGDQKHISLSKKLTSGNDKNYVCVDFEFNTKEFYERVKSPDEYLLSGGLKVKEFGKGYSLYSLKDDSAGYLIDKDIKNVVALPSNSGGMKLAATIRFNCIQGDIDNLKLDYNQQINSVEYKEGIDIIGSLIKNLN